MSWNSKQTKKYQDFPENKAKRKLTKKMLDPILAEQFLEEKLKKKSIKAIPGQ